MALGCRKSKLGCSSRQHVKKSKNHRGKRTGHDGKAPWLNSYAALRAVLAGQRNGECPGRGRDKPSVPAHDLSPG